MRIRVYRRNIGTVRFWVELKMINFGIGVNADVWAFGFGKKQLL